MAWKTSRANEISMRRAMIDNGATTGRDTQRRSSLLDVSVLYEDMLKTSWTAAFDRPPSHISFTAPLFDLKYTPTPLMTSRNSSGESSVTNCWQKWQSLSTSSPSMLLSTSSINWHIYQHCRHHQRHHLEMQWKQKHRWRQQHNIP